MVHCADAGLTIQNPLTLLPPSLLPSDGEGMYGSGQLTVKFLQHLRIHHVQLDVIAFAFAFASFSAARIITAARSSQY